MKCKLWKRIAAMALSAAMITTSLNLVTDTQEAEAASTLIWSDEFNGTSLDTSKWTYEIGTGSWGWGNNEYQYYTDRNENVSVHDGALHITARAENYNGSSYTSGRIKTQDKFEFTYGYVEARIAVPTCQGIWPAFWMLGANISEVSWPYCGEIDIMEAVNAEGKAYGTFHWDNGGHANYGQSTAVSNINAYHVYGLEWDSEYMRIYVDGYKYQEMYIGGNTGGTEEFHKDFFLLLNVAVCGNWPGFNVNAGDFPRTMSVDYVRVYQDRPTSSGSSSSGTVSNTSSGDVYIYQDINYGGRSASLGLGDYNMSDLNAKGFLNDDLSSIKVPFGYKVTLYEDINFTGATKVITSDTSWIGNDWNDRTTSIRVEKAQYRIVNRHSNLNLDIAWDSNDNGANIQQWGVTGNANQAWYISQNDDYSFSITSVKNGKALDVAEWSTSNGGNIHVWDNGYADNQKWWITDLGNGYSSIINKHSNKCLDVADWSTAAGGNIHQYDYYEQANQQWYFVLIN